jgi:cytochrome c-type biogenesis protein CcmH
MQMNSLFIYLIAMGILALPLVFYPLRLLKKNMFFLTAIIMLAMGLAYWHWGAGDKWLEHLQKEDKQKKIQALLQTIKSPEQLLEKLKISLQNNPDKVRGWYLLGRLYASQGQWLLAKEAYKKAYNLHPDETITVNYAQSLWQVNQQQFNPLIRRLFRNLLRKNPNQPDALAMLAMDAFGQQNYAQAIAYWQQLLQLAPEQSAEAQVIRKAIAKAQGEMRKEHE